MQTEHFTSNLQHKIASVWHTSLKYDSVPAIYEVQGSVHEKRNVPLAKHNSAALTRAEHV
jgi:hypothetical protein